MPPRIRPSTLPVPENLLTIITSATVMMLNTNAEIIIPQEGTLINAASFKNKKVLAENSRLREFLAKDYNSEIISL